MRVEEGTGPEWKDLLSPSATFSLPPASYLYFCPYTDQRTAGQREIRGSEEEEKVGGQEAFNFPFPGGGCVEEEEEDNAEEEEQEEKTRASPLVAASQEGTEDGWGIKKKKRERKRSHTGGEATL